MAKSKKAKKPSVPMIDEAYAKILIEAIQTHGTGKAYTGELFLLLTALERKSVRRPNDWTIQYTGPIELRWYDGGGEFHKHRKWIGITILKDGFTIRGRTDMQNPYNSDSSITIPRLTLIEVSDIFPVMAQIVDKPEETKDN